MKKLLILLLIGVVSCRTVYVTKTETTGKGKHKKTITTETKKKRL